MALKNLPSSEKHGEKHVQSIMENLYRSITQRDIYPSSSTEECYFGACIDTTGTPIKIAQTKNFLN